MDEKLLDWEDNSAGLPLYKHMIAGSLAGVSEHAISFPFDTLRTFAQAESTQISSLSASWKFVKKLGFFELWRGVETVFYGCIPAHALYFLVYELSREHFKIQANSDWYLLSTSITGVLATIVHDSIMTPMDVVKQRIQLKRDMRPIKMMRFLINTEGAICLYRSLPITIFMNIPQSALFMTIYENLKSFIFWDGNVSMSGYFGCAGIAGSVSAGVTTPFDVVKTRLQTQGEESKLVEGKVKEMTGKENRYVNVRQCVKYIWEKEGIKGFFRGIGPRMMMFLPGAAVSWSSYEYIKMILNN